MVKEELLARPELFIVNYFPDKVPRLEDFHLRLIETATTEKRGLILYPATHGKTTLVSTLLPIWAFCCDPNIRIALITKNDDDASNIMQAIIGELLGNERLLYDFGPFYADGRPFGTKRISIAKRTRMSKEPTIIAFGSGSRAALGHRTDWTICDDIITDRNSATPEQRAKIKEWFMQGPLTMAEEADDRITVVGTLFDPEDLYHDLRDMRTIEEGTEIWKTQREDAILDEENRITLWPKRWPWVRLMEQKAEMGTLDFNKRFRNLAVDKSRMVFKQEYVEGGYVGKTFYPGCIDRSYSLGDFDPNWRRASGFDPAIGITKSRKFCAHVVLARGACDKHEACFWVVDLLREQLTLPQQVEIILDKHKQYDLSMSWIEANAYQAGLYQAVQQKMNERGEAWKIDPHYTSRTNKPNPELGIQAMAPWFENGKVHIPWADVHSQKVMRQLVEELITYPGKYTDTVMAFWMAWKALQESAPRYFTSTYLKKPLAWQHHRRVIKNPYYQHPDPFADRR